MAKKQKAMKVNMWAVLFAAISLIILGGVLYKQMMPAAKNNLTTSSSVEGANTNSGGFDEFGYNYKAMNFVGKADGVDRILDGKVWGDPLYANDHLVMKWSKAWDDARFHGAQWTPDAWVDNEWNGKLPNGSDVTEHVKIIWVGSSLENSQYWRAGGSPIWGEFEVIMDQGMTGTSHYWYAHAVPNGFGGQQ